MLQSTLLILLLNMCKWPAWNLGKIDLQIFVRTLHSMFSTIAPPICARQPQHWRFAHSSLHCCRPGSVQATQLMRAMAACAMPQSPASVFGKKLKLSLLPKNRTPSFFRPRPVYLLILTVARNSPFATSLLSCLSATQTMSSLFVSVVPIPKITL